jgi:hypothetical protein
MVKGKEDGCRVGKGYRMEEVRWRERWKEKGRGDGEREKKRLGGERER